MGRGILKGGVGRLEGGGEIKGGVVIEKNVRERVREWLKKGNDRLIRRDVREGRAVFKRNKVDVPMVQDDEDVLMVQNDEDVLISCHGFHGKAFREIRGWPLVYFC
jgi:hypothetical protein